MENENKRIEILEEYLSDEEIDEYLENKPQIDDKNLESFNYNKSQIDSPRKKFEEIYQNVDDEEEKILALETRRLKLEKDMELLQKEIEYEKVLFREAIDFEIDRRHEPSPRSSYSSIKTTVLNPFSIDKDEIHNRLKDFQNTLEQTTTDKNDPDIEQYKLNLSNYKKGLQCNEIEQTAKEKRKATNKIFEKHLQQVEEKCVEHIDRLENIQKNIEKDFRKNFSVKNL